MSTYAKIREGSTGREATDMSADPIRRGNGDSTPRRHRGQRGRPVTGAEQRNVTSGDGLRQESGGRSTDEAG